jgi:hypothetical protein
MGGSQRGTDLVLAAGAGDRRLASQRERQQQTSVGFMDILSLFRSSIQRECGLRIFPTTRLPFTSQQWAGEAC